MPHFLRFASLVLFASLAASASACAGASDTDQESAGLTAASVTLDASLRGVATEGLRNDLRATLGEAASLTEAATLAGVVTVSPDIFGDAVALSASAWSVEPGANGTFDLSFSSDPDATGNAPGPAQRLSEAMRNATVKSVPTIVGENVTRRSPKGRISCLFASSFHQGESRYTCTIKGLTTLGPASPER